MTLANSPWKEKQNWGAHVAAYITQVLNSIRRDHDTKKTMETLEQLDEKASKRARKARSRHLPHNNVVYLAHSYRNHTPYRARQLRNEIFH